MIQRVLPFLAMAIPPLALGCGGSVTLSGGGAGGEGGSTTSSASGGEGGATTSSSSGGDGGSTTSTTSTDVPPGFCGDACANPSAGGCVQTADCTDYCEAHLPDWPASVAGAFKTCIAENPLCFASIEGCILSELYPADAVHTVKLTGTGFDAWNGKTLHVWHDPEVDPMFGAEVVLADGQFAFEWSAPFQANDAGGPLLLMYVDMDGDGACVAAADITHSTFTEWNGDYLAPVFSATVTPPLNDGDFVCDFPP